MGLKIHLRYVVASFFILLSALRKYHVVLIFWSELETNSLPCACQSVSSPYPVAVRGSAVLVQHEGTHRLEKPGLSSCKRVACRSALGVLMTNAPEVLEVLGRQVTLDQT